jgi:P-type Ca2+ transporter type 2C
VDDVFTGLRTQAAGLSSEEAKRRLSEYGPNTLEKGHGPSLLKVIISQFTDPLIYILIIAMLLTALLQDWVDTAVITAAIALNAVIGVWQELKAEGLSRP